MDVAVTDLRSHLSEWLQRVQEGEEIVVTERGLPVARVTGVNGTGIIERLTAEGVIARPGRTVRPVAKGRARARTRAPLSEIVSEQRR